MLSNYNVAGQSMIFPPRTHECMQTSMYEADLSYNDIMSRQFWTLNTER